MFNSVAYHREMCTKEADRNANYVDPDCLPYGAQIGMSRVMPLHDEMQTEFQKIKTLIGMFIGAVCGVYEHLSDNFVPYHTR